MRDVLAPLHGMKVAILGADEFERGYAGDALRDAAGGWQDKIVSPASETVRTGTTRNRLIHRSDSMDDSMVIIVRAIHEA